MMVEQRRSPLGIGIGVTAMAVISYPLSIGPMEWIIIRFGSPAWTQPAFEFVYGPMIWLQDFGPAPLGKLLGWYFAWWWS